MNLADQAHFLNYSPSSFGWSDPAHPNRLVPFEFNGVNFGQCRKEVHGLFTALLTELVPHIEGGLHSGSCWAYSTTDDLAGGVWSFHHYGIAMDINWNVNEMGNNIPDAQGRYALPRALTSALAKKYGCEWGGNWSGGFHDDMHIECHLTPAVAATVGTTPTGDWFDMATEAELRTIIQQELARGTAHVRSTDLVGDAKGGGHLLETFLGGIPGYKSLAARAVKPKAVVEPDAAPDDTEAGA